MTYTPQTLDHSRRRFLIKTGWLAAGVTALTSCSGLIPVLPTTANPKDEDGSSWIQILADGRVRFLCPRMEMGQGATIGLSQIVAEELGVTQDQIECLAPDSDQLGPFKMTVGSEGIARFSGPVAMGAAGLREHFRQLAADKVLLPFDQIEDAAGGFTAAGNFIGYGELVPDQARIIGAEYRADVVPRFADRNGNSRAIGKSWKSPELKNIVTGQTIYSRDIAVPDMLYGDIVRPPRYGATLKEAINRGAETLPGVVSVVIDEANDLVAVVAKSPFVLADALEKIETTWQSSPDEIPDDILDVSLYRTRGDFEHSLMDEGSARSADKAAIAVTSANYTTSYMAHAAMEPRAAVAWVREEEVEIWCGCQDPYFVRGRVAALLKRDQKEVVVHPLRMGGGFGGRVLCQPAEEAAVLSARVGMPVRVQWDRETEFQHNYFQPKFSHAIDSGLDEAGHIAFWRHDFVSSPIIFGLVPSPFASILDAFVADEGTARGADMPYDVSEHKRVRYSDIRTGIPTGAWRGLGAAPNTFAIESTMDELAYSAGKDPLAFRLSQLENNGGNSKRLSEVLRRVGKMADWGKSVDKNLGLGVAAAVYKDQTFVAVVAEVRIDQQREQISVTSLWCAQDCGLVVNPDQVENQVLGNLIWGCGMALKEKLTFNEGAPGQLNFDSYEVLRHVEAPRTFIELVETPGAPPVAVGESAFAPAVAAIANAAFAATGKRPRQLPFDYDSLQIQ
ncbi:MAG: xanthine dehydrogenase family protein molybdopterin-binding subunit [Alphaproteobacteria bacterium]|jgi:isoquinoline 1-oxidoreductase subunit beta|nr:xanthine dehydrogenase family protein molybdopterin-binding subunit [Alphaproteobacteria bacterium]MBT4082357.1 xanthine dehydrogenase family protein molybdopterin-binding subunit [Alphaproteobacteria bacterium]MBT4545459.1 xanthine dehydrogenase family protein molybdopterin-binding subunit [Alphaproteobacteria bacterium]MBT7746459.1 xanthine dehydrogenase family protein molybdopterin-binding subunit [Alphaproteobacteria bacterium]